MIDKIAEKLSQMSKEELIELIRMLCDNKANVQKLSLLVAPTQKDFERAISQFESCCDRCYCNSDSEAVFDALYEKANVLMMSADKARIEMRAKIYYEILRSIHIYQLYEFCDDGIADFCFDAEDELKGLIEEHGDKFPDAILKKYRSVVDFND